LKLKKAKKNSLFYLSFLFIAIGIIFYLFYIFPVECKLQFKGENSITPYFEFNQKYKTFDFIFGVHISFIILGLFLLVIWLNKFRLLTYTELFNLFKSKLFSDKKCIYIFVYLFVFIFVYLFLYIFRHI